MITFIDDEIESAILLAISVGENSDGNINELRSAIREMDDKFEKLKKYINVLEDSLPDSGCQWLVKDVFDE